MKRTLAAIAACAALGSTAGAQGAAPPAQVEPFTETLFGTQISDPYRYMENLKDPYVLAWMHQQTAYAQSVLQRLDPARARLRTRIGELSGLTDAVGSVQRAGESLFYLKRAAGTDQYVLFVREHSHERALFDPMAGANAEKHYAINYYAPSFDGTRVALGVSEGGSEETTLRVLDVATGALGSESIDRTDSAGVSWRPDGTSFFYNRLQLLKPGMLMAEKNNRSRVYLHRLGDSPDKDVAVFGYGVSPGYSLDETQETVVAATPGSRWALAFADHGTDREVTVYAAPLADVTGPSAPWRKILDLPDQAVATGLIGDDLYVLAHHRSPKFEIGRMDLSAARPSVEPFVDPSDDVLQSMAVAKDGVYVTYQNGSSYGMRRKRFAPGAALEDVKLPFNGAAYDLDADPRYAGLTFGIQGWVNPPQYLLANGPSDVSDLGIQPKSKADFTGYVADETFATAADGTKIPLSIIHAAGMPLDGSHPMILDGYGSYGISIDPYFQPRLLAWLERGGNFAFAHVRGGGEYGQTWHDAGKKLTKPNTWLDFIACAQYLIDRKWTSASRLSGEGTSAGGITIGRAITTRPDLFAAANINVGESNALRSETYESGPQNVAEFGTYKEPDGFKALYEMDAYMHVKKGVAYPGVILTTGFNDPRVKVWELGKMAARLQASTSSGRPVLLRIGFDEGHGIGSTRAQRDDLTADVWAFYLWQSGVAEFAPKP